MPGFDPSNKFWDALPTVFTADAPLANLESEVRRIRIFRGRARLFDGRWNFEGVPMVYISSSLALAAIEFFVHLNPSDAPNDLVSVKAELPDRLNT